MSDPRWQERRRQLFELYCLPSVARQTAPDFTWLFLVYADLTSEADARWFRKRDVRLRILEVEDPESPGTAEAREAVDVRLSGDDMVVTTRLDSDDILHPDHLRRVRIPHDRERRAVEFLNGPRSWCLIERHHTRTGSGGAARTTPDSSLSGAADIGDPGVVA